MCPPCASMRFDRLDLNLLRVLDIVLTERNVTRSAERLGVTQQAISNSLKKLRETFDDPLLVRRGHNMTLTPLAASMLGPLREALLRLEALVTERPGFDPATTARTFRVAMPHYHSFVLLPQALRTLAAEAPLIGLQVQVPAPSDMVMLERGELDLIAIENGDDGEPRSAVHNAIHRHRLLEDDHVCLIDQRCSDLEEHLTIEHYLRLPHCVMRPNPAARMQVERGWERFGVSPRVAAVAPGYAVMVLSLPGTGLIATVPRRVAGVFAASLGLRELECPIPIAPLCGELRWHQHFDTDPAHLYLRSVFRSVVEQEDDRLRPAMTSRNGRTLVT